MRTLAELILEPARRYLRRRSRLVGKIIALDPPASVVDDAGPDDPADADAIRLHRAKARLKKELLKEDLLKEDLLKEDLLKAQEASGHVRHEGGSTDGSR